MRPPRKASPASLVHPRPRHHESATTTRTQSKARRGLHSSPRRRSSVGQSTALVKRGSWVRIPPSAWALNPKVAGSNRAPLCPSQRPSASRKPPPGGFLRSSTRALTPCWSGASRPATVHRGWVPVLRATPCLQGASSCCGLLPFAAQAAQRVICPMQLLPSAAVAAPQRFHMPSGGAVRRGRAVTFALRLVGPGWETGVDPPRGAFNV